MIFVYIAFSDELWPDPDSAAIELGRAGYQVFRLPDNHPIPAEPLDDHIECLIEGRKRATPSP